MRRFLLATFGLGWLFQLLWPTSYFWLAATMWTPALGALAEGHRIPPPKLGGPLLKTTSSALGLSGYLKIVWPVAAWTALMVLTAMPFSPPRPRLPEVPEWQLPLLVLLPVVLPLVPIINAFLGAFGEEYGWRGYLLPRLAQRLGYFKAAVVVGVVWGVWHAPAILLGYEYGWLWRVEGVLLFIPITILLSLLHTAAYLRGGVWGAAFLHGAVNGWAPLYFVLFPHHFDARWLWGPVGLRGFSTLLPIVYLAWRHTFKKETGFGHGREDCGLVDGGAVQLPAGREAV